MHKTIEFPHIGIYLKSVGDHITIFGFDIAYYGIIIGLGILAGILIAASEAKRTRQNPEDYFDLAIYAVIIGIIGARLYYVAFSWDMYKDNLLSILNIREGGLAIYGGVIAGVATAVVFTRVKRMSAPLVLDTACLGLVTGQMVGRWGNFFNREAFGDYTDSVFAMRLPLDAVRESDVAESIRSHIENINGVDYIQVHPTFLYESVWCLFILLLLLLYRSHKNFDGELFLIYLLSYGMGRFWIEAMRTDQLLIPGTELPVSQVLAGALVLVSLVIIVYKRRSTKLRQKKP